MNTLNNKGFVKRPTQATTDYVSMVNNLLKDNPDGINVNSVLYRSALDQYNLDKIKGSTTRLEVPKGFCGYIDPTSGEFRVAPDPYADQINPGVGLPNPDFIPVDAPPLPPGSYPVDECLQNGLPGSPQYTQKNDEGELIDINCGNDIDLTKSTGIDWSFTEEEKLLGVPEGYSIASVLAAEEAAAAAEAAAQAAAGEAQRNKHRPWYEIVFLKTNPWLRW